MFHNTTGKPIYVNTARTKVVAEDDPDAGFLLVGPAGTLPEDEAARYGLRGGNAPKVDPLADAKEAHEDALARGAFEEARSHQNRIADLEAAEEGKKLAARRTARPADQAEAKAVQAPPANKGA